MQKYTFFLSIHTKGLKLFFDALFRLKDVIFITAAKRQRNLRTDTAQTSRTSYCSTFYFWGDPSHRISFFFSNSSISHTSLLSNPNKYRSLPKHHSNLRIDKVFIDSRGYRGMSII
jgi:hypothetical protein